MADKVWTRFQQMKSKYTVVHDEMERIDDYLSGRFDDSFVDGTLLRDEPRGKAFDGSRRIVANLIDYSVRDKVSLEGQWPTFDVPPRDDKSEDHAQLIKEILYSTYQASAGMELLQRNSYNKYAYGWSVMGALPDFESDRVQVVCYSPRYCCPVFKMGSRVFLREMYISWYETPEAVAAEYPGYKADGEGQEDEKVELLQYFDTNRRATYADGKLLKGVEHNWGFVPFVVIPCELTPDGLGIGSVHQSVGLNIALNKFIDLSFKITEDTVRSDYKVTGATEDEVQGPTKIGNENYIFLPDGADIGRIAPPTANFPELFKIMGDIQSLMQVISGTNAARMGQREGMYVSAKGQGSLQQPLGQRVDNSLRVQGERMEILNQYILKLYERHWADEPVTLYGFIPPMARTQADKKGKAISSYSRRFKGKQIKGYYRNSVSWMPSILSDAGSRIIQVLQLTQAKLMSNYSAMNMIGLVDTDFETKQIIEETLKDAELQRQIQELLTPQIPPEIPSGGGQPVDMEKQQLQLERGLTNPSNGMFEQGQPPVGPGVPPSPEVMQQAAMAGGGMPQAPVPGFIPPEATAGLTPAETIIETVRGTPNIKGQVWLVGKGLYVGSYDADDPVELAITNPLDKQTINNAFRDTPVFGRIKYIVATAEPRELHLDITPGTQGYQMEGEDIASTQQGAAPQNAPALPAGQDLQGIAGTVYGGGAQ